MPHGQNLLQILKKYNNEPYVFFIRAGQIFLKGQYGSISIVPDSNISKDAWILETEIKNEPLMEINKGSLRGQYGSDCNIFWRLMKILWKGNMDRTILSFMIFLPYCGFRKPGK